MSVPSKPVFAQSTRHVLELAKTRFRLQARRRAAWLRHLWSEEGESISREAITHVEVEGILSGRDSREAELEWVGRQPWSAEWMAELEAVEHALEQDVSSRLAYLKRTFELGSEEMDVCQACVTVALEPSFGRLCAYLQDHVGRAYMTDELASRLYLHGSIGAPGPDSALYRWEIVSSRDVGPGEPRALTCDPEIRKWLTEQDTPFGARGAAPSQERKAPLASWPVKETADFIDHHIRSGADFIDHHIRSGASVCLRIIVSGSRGSGRRTFAAAVSDELSLPLLIVDLDQVDDPQWRRVHLLAQRQAFLRPSALAWYGESIARRMWPTVDPVFPVQFLIAEPGQEPIAKSGVIEHTVRMPCPSVQERIDLWRQYVPSSLKWPELDFRGLVERYRVQVGDIASVAQSRAPTAHEAGLRVREAARGRLANLAQLLRCPFEWDDLVVPAGLREALEDIVFEANHRVAFWERSEARRLFPQGQGLMALFSGPPGTGKTMAAQVVAATLGYDLFRVDLARVLSKWVGETSQNFERILTRAAEMHAIILFDECDAIFTKRTTEVRDAQDKFANSDAAYLLQAIESYPGVALLATNQKSNVDPAFIRRLRYVLEFAKPGVEQRTEIWRKIVHGLAGEDRVESLNGSLDLLSEAVEATGAQIKYAVLGAMFRAKREGAPLNLTHLLRGLERELGKEGRALSARERERILSHAR